MTAVRQETLNKGLTLPPFEDAVPLMITFSPNWPARKVLFRVFGTALILGSAGMWMLPGSLVSADTALMKLGTSVFFFLCGLALLMMHHEHTQPDAYFDPIRREVRVLQKDNRGRPQTVLRRGYDSLGSAKFTESSLEIYDMDGSTLMRLPIQTAEIRQALRAQLSGLVNIAT